MSTEDQKAREAFEAWALPRVSDYSISPTQFAWAAWQAALMSNAAPEIDMSGRRVEAARRNALDEAAKACEDVEPVTYWFGGQTYDDAGATRRDCAAAIRALADPPQGKEAL